ncbi:pyruvate dehydrogenase E2 component (dihydrolipoamide acetyltransferase)/2-oxoglutarate dehydrogenase E2 component (dihydrolipoamide succinyltransferase) [Yoonia rosea]|uniref:Pyruvate dehydrogenase E2 component (Dihydrolipoamide acetyltransferase)/2-oxoglutarate dehydrogenase E2 component (Dihydrolipoamide succinyltransferase) n=1 Tax=Yoonia rosea TaxID=287098 RepID=A0A1R3WVD0_9RHOB|nr:biotin/lipoyl-containing protein [Yoonia rosea]SIT81343.1 pyruvate dehydrogenase E2 component (dihydrolipoamide acetyltransferase)/2-oxoglutarate dehydrogenase E2 component (dihydrolipoamide succinyltransferase) [Yoonia rosea]
MPLDVIMPALGMAQETGLIVAWHKQPGDAVTKGDILFEVETDKATMEIEAAADGFLTDVAAGEGTDVPVGNVIAKISDSAESAASAPAEEAAPAPSDDLPEGKEVIMPTLGMAQDSGLLVAWHKNPGDAVSVDHILFEVETDKSVNEVNAGFDGYLGATLAEAGEDVPTGQTIAIITAEKPANPVARKSAAAPAPQAAVVEEKPAPVAKAQPAKVAPAPATHGRILASPKLRRLALEQGLDLQRLVDAGHPQPFHVKDLDALRALPQTSGATQTTAAQVSGRLTAEIASEGFTDFADWAAKSAQLTDTAALLAGLCAASHGSDTTIAVESFGMTKTYAASAQLSATDPTEDAARLRVRDLRFSAITSVAVGAEDVPTLTLTRTGTGLTITLEFAPAQLAPSDAITLLSNFAGRMEQPLRHLL